jgi:hypothetical protein
LEKVACGAFCACPLRYALPAARKPWVAILATRSTQCVSPLDGTLRVDLRSTKRAPARLSDISFVSAGCAPRAKKRRFCRLRSREKYKYSALLRLALRAATFAAFKSASCRLSPTG